MLRNAALSVLAIAGVLLGELIAGSSVGGWVEQAILRLIDVLLLSLARILGFGTVQVAVAMGVTAIAGFARLIWAEVVTVRRLDYVEAAFGSGGRFLAVLWRHVLPNALTSVWPMRRSSLAGRFCKSRRWGFSAMAHRRPRRNGV